MLSKLKEPILYYLIFVSFSFIILGSVDHYKTGGRKWILVENYEQKVNSSNYLEEFIQDYRPLMAMVLLDCQKVIFVTKLKRKTTLTNAMLHFGRWELWLEN